MLVLVAWGGLPVLAWLSQSNSGDSSLTTALGRGGMPPVWVTEGVELVGLVGMALGGYLLLGSFLLRKPRSSWARAASWRRWGRAALLLAAWVALGTVENVTSRTTGEFDAVEAQAGYLLLPAALGAVGWLAVTDFRDVLRTAWSRPRQRWVTAGLMVAFTVYYLWTNKLVQVPSPHDMPPHGAPSFMAASSYYGPLAVWPSLEFWVAPLKVAGALSVGTAMVTVTLAALTALVLASYLAMSRQGTARRPPGKSAVLGAIGAAGVSGCCCCAPALFPITALLLGTAGAGSLSAWLSGSSAPFSDLIQTVTIVFMLGVLARQQRRLCVHARRAGPAATAPRWHLGTFWRAGKQPAYSGRTSGAPFMTPETTKAK
jgi:hypothetical protein